MVRGAHGRRHGIAQGQQPGRSNGRARARGGYCSARGRVLLLAVGRVPGYPASARKRRSRRLLPTTKTDEQAIAAPAIIGLSRPAAASGSAATL